MGMGTWGMGPWGHGGMGTWGHGDMIARWHCYSTEHLQRFCEDGTHGDHTNWMVDGMIPAHIRIIVPNQKGHVQVFFPQGARPYNECPLYLKSLDVFLSKDAHVCFETHFHFFVKRILIKI